MIPRNPLRIPRLVRWLDRCERQSLACWGRRAGWDRYFWLPQRRLAISNWHNRHIGPRHPNGYGDASSVEYYHIASTPSDSYCEWRQRISDTDRLILPSGGYTSAATTLNSGSAMIDIPAGSLATGSDTLTASYTSDSASSLTYNRATGSNTVTVTAASVKVCFSPHWAQSQRCLDV